ncbi:hypothetical protein DAPPUDRAFT_228860 [Daphnia pulex]|uniref:Uncharacterized protein n=1 Tax=Daphnia pulex TaxID=6669 RepID=E9HHK4_DAPPU|nr:hypothetical protein DAPPUDRAFT_228860 [Daphnia pulex]|eukprot:EFX68802.1 hypothetical protein DAPPUDRAFT_228860 [Daphnia pulex]
MSSYGARPKTKSIFRKNLEDLNDISTDKTVPILPTKLPLSVPITSTPLASTAQKRQTIDTRVINRPTRSNKNYVQLKSIPPEYLFKRNGERKNQLRILSNFLLQTISHGNEDGRNTINSQQIRVFGDERTEKATPKLLDELRDNKVNYGYLEEGASSNRYFPTSGIFQNSYQESVRPIFLFSSSSSGFPNPSEINPFKRQADGDLDSSVRNDSPFSCICELCSERANNDNQIHQRDLGIPTGSGDIQYQIRNDQSCLGPETAGNFLSLPPTQTAIVDIELSPTRSERKVNFALQPDNQHNKSERLPYFPVVSGSEFIAPFQPNYPRSGVHSSDIDTPNYLSGACATNEVNQKSPDEDTVSEKIRLVRCTNRKQKSK